MSLFRRKTLQALALLGMTCSSAHAEKPQILTLRLGMTPQEVKAAMAQAGQLVSEKTATISYGQKYTELPASQHLARMTFTVANPGFTSTEIRDVVDVLFSPEPGNERVVLIAREQWFHDGARPLPQDRVTQYESKYGAPGLRGARSPMSKETLLRWNYDASGNPLGSFPQDAVRWCNPSIESGVLGVARFYKTGAHMRELCGDIALTAVLDPDLQQQRVIHAYTLLVDFASIYGAQDRVQARIQQLEAAADDKEQSRMRSAAPAL